MKEPVGKKLGYFIGETIAVCLTVLIIATVVALTAKAIVGLALWLF